MWQPRQSVRKSFEVVLAGLAASNQDQPQPSPQSLFPGNRPTLSFTRTNQPARVPALLTVPVVISLVSRFEHFLYENGAVGKVSVLAIRGDGSGRCIDDVHLL